LSLLRNELELQGFYFLNIGGSYFSKFLFEGKINKILSDVKKSKEVFQWWVKIVDFTRYSTYNFPAFVAT